MYCTFWKSTFSDIIPQISKFQLDKKRIHEKDLDIFFYLHHLWSCCFFRCHSSLNLTDPLSLHFTLINSIPSMFIPTNQNIFQDTQQSWSWEHNLTVYSSLIWESQPLKEHFLINRFYCDRYHLCITLRKAKKKDELSAFSSWQTNHILLLLFGFQSVAAAKYA